MQRRFILLSTITLFCLYFVIICAHAAKIPTPDPFNWVGDYGLAFAITLASPNWFGAFAKTRRQTLLFAVLLGVSAVLSVEFGLIKLGTPDILDVPMGILGVALGAYWLNKRQERVSP